ncbi:SlyX protein [Idiomarina fontislapidosi]|uniref:Protein SlyX homolog n=1 Tax=Idiomarina fontislapidosi TaxID=263723 RepID=A0A432Y7X9_9GAMM|nr:SlyX family protein [Idiomarina fontislapidosi]PYE32376.1 SlyX protein [Idiomarina fontislapidosi]RUO57080.1 SlyX protein [Idiomarina fontislapidosi]|tara:strand:- start:55 stop:285 length:231 start_codon:yes stop_codon:yes gene_type:complete
MKDVEQLQNRIDNLESQLAFQEDIIDSLNQRVTEHNKELAEVARRMKYLGERLRQIQDNQSSPDADPSAEPPPPHY